MIILIESDTMLELNQYSHIYITAGSVIIVIIIITTISSVAIQKSSKLHLDNHEMHADHRTGDDSFIIRTGIFVLHLTARFQIIWLHMCRTI